MIDETHMQQRLLDVQGHQLAVISANEDRPGTPVVFLHGITASVEFWLPSLPNDVRDTIHWISLSLPGHFPSRLPANYSLGDLTAEGFAEVEVAALSRLLGDQPVALVGWSTGGFTALDIAAHFPERVRSVLSLAGFAAGRWRGLAGLMQGFARRGRLGKRVFRMAYALLARQPELFRLVMRQASANRRAFHESPVSRATLNDWHEALQHQDFEALADLFEGISRYDICDVLCRITAPALIVGGDRDPYIPVAHTRVIAERIPGAELVVLENAGHMFFADCPERYQQLLVDWLNRAAGHSLRLEPADSPQAGRGAESERTQAKVVSSYISHKV
jgi:pimeloyl-ACP methyl ester carboxylesterase